VTSGALRSGQVAEAAGVNLQTLRYYERRGLLEEPQRSNGGHRLYPQEAVTVLRGIKQVLIGTAGPRRGCNSERPRRSPRSTPKSRT
jgi:hypothetical protein